MKKKFLALALIATLSTSVNTYASGRSDWNERFALKGGHWVEHSQKYVTLDGMFRASQALHFNAGAKLNGMEITGCGLHLFTDSTREEFVQSLLCSGLYPA